jgi:acetyl-CoA carboxylase biotin carboxyl carrier protein
MIDLDFIERLIRVFDDSGVDSLEIERGGTRIRLSKTPPSVAVPAAFAPTHAAAPAPYVTAPVAAAPGTEEARTAERPALPRSHLLEIVSPMVGTFYRAPAPDAPPYVSVGQRVASGDTVCIIEAMKLMNELEGEVTGTIVEVCVENAQPVEYGQVLFRVDPR